MFLGIFISAFLHLHSASAGSEELLRLITSPVGRYVFEQTETGSALARRLLGRELIAGENLSSLAKKIAAEKNLTPLADLLEQRLRGIESEILNGRKLAGEAAENAFRELSLEERIFVRVRTAAPTAREGLAGAFDVLPKEYQTIGSRLGGSYRSALDKIGEKLATGKSGAEVMPVGYRAGLLLSPKAAEASLLKTFSQAEVSDAVAFLLKKYEIGEEELIRRLANHHLSVQELLNRFEKGIIVSKDASALTQIYEKMAWGLKDRSLSNPDYLKRLAIMVGVELSMTAVGEYKARGEHFQDEMDYFIADLVAFALTEVVLGWGTAGRMSEHYSVRQVMPQPPTIWARDFAVKDRALMFGKKAAFLGGMTTATCLTGFGAVEAYRYIMAIDDPNAPSGFDRLKTVMWRSALAGVFIGTWANFRYQTVEAVNEVIARKWLNKSTGVHAYARRIIYSSLYLGNNYTGSYSWVVYENTVNKLYQKIIDELSTDEDSATSPDQKSPK